MSILKKKSSIKFIRNKKGRVVKTVRTGNQTFKSYDLSKQIKDFEDKQKASRKAKRKYYSKKIKKSVSKTGKWFDRNIASESEMLRRLKKL